MTSNTNEINTKNRFNEIVSVAKKYHLGKLLISSSKRRKGESYDEDLDFSNLRLCFEELGPAFVKLGQILCTRPDLVGVEIAEDLKKLRDDTKTTPLMR